MQWGPTDEDPEDGLPERGWIPPEARAWRHPSELVGGGGAVAVFDPDPGWRRGASVLVGATAVAAILVGALLLVSTGSTPITTTDASVPIATAAVTPCCTLSPALAREAAEAVVAVTHNAANGAQTGCGVVVGDGVAVTTISALDGRHVVRVVTATGRALPAVVVATDKTSGVALLHFAATLPTAHLGAQDAIDPGTSALALALRAPRGAGTPRPVWTSGTVVSVGRPATTSTSSSTPPSTAATTAATPGMAQITMDSRSVPDVPGEPLIDAQGRVIGILDWTHGARHAFLPMSLVAGVGTDLETTGVVRHGWLGVTDTTPRHGKGALVVWVDPNGAAARALRPGDVIVRLDGFEVQSSAQLRSMLYVMSPGTKVAVQIERGARVLQANLELAASP